MVTCSTPNHAICKRQVAAVPPFNLLTNLQRILRAQIRRQRAIQCGFAIEGHHKVSRLWLLLRDLADYNSIKSSALVYYDNFDLTWSTVSLPFACASAARVCACDAMLDVVSLAFNARALSRPPALSNKGLALCSGKIEAPGKVPFAFQRVYIVEHRFPFPIHMLPPLSQTSTSCVQRIVVHRRRGCTYYQ
jgi:hypothetical protein